jgi:catechol 2,3-dioxygenase-like lactoylglutathione lyase family enzyme
MPVVGLRWLGVPTERYDEMVAFLRDGLGLTMEFEHEGTAELSAPNGDRVQVFAPGHSYHARFDKEQGPVPLFEVDELRAAIEQVERAGGELLGEIEHDEVWEWIDFRAPDGNRYELAALR